MYTTYYLLLTRTTYYLLLTRTTYYSLLTTYYLLLTSEKEHLILVAPQDVLGQLIRGGHRRYTIPAIKLDTISLTRLTKEQEVDEGQLEPREQKSRGDGPWRLRGGAPAFP